MHVLCVSLNLKSALFKPGQTQVRLGPPVALSMPVGSHKKVGTPLGAGSHHMGFSGPWCTRAGSKQNTKQVTVGT